MFKKTLIAFTFCLLLLSGICAIQSVTGRTRGERSTPMNREQAANAQRSTINSELQTGTLQKMIVENGSVTMDLDLNGLNGSNSLVARPITLQFVAGANSFFPILVFNDLLRGLVPGSMALIPVEAAPNAFGGSSVSQATRLPLQFGASLKQLVVEKLPSGQGFDLAVRDS